MPLNLGSSAVSLYLGSQAVNAYLGDVLVTPPAGPFTLYFNGAVDGNWATLGNWWLDDEHAAAATALPTAADSVIATATISSNSGSAPTVVNFTLNNLGGVGFQFGINITVTGNATFNGSSQNNGGTINGDATFNDDSLNGGTINGDATFNDSSLNFGTVTGTITDNR